MNLREYNFAVRSSQFAVRHFYLILAVVSLLALFFLSNYAGIDSYWVDELYTVSAIRNNFSFSDTVKVYSHLDVNAPLYHFAAYFWYRLVPQTEQAMRTLSIIFSLLACIVIGITAKNLKDARTGLLAFLFMLASRSMLINAAFQFRPYSMLLLAAVLNLYFYLARLKHETWTNIILYGITMCLITYTHYVAVLFCFGMFIADCALVLRKRAGIRVILSYFLGAMLFVPWLYLTLASRVISDFGSFWPKVPAFKDIVSICKWLAGAHSVTDIMFWLTLCGIFYVVRQAYKFASEQEKFSAEVIFSFAGIFSSAFMILSAFVYSRFINPNGSFFVERYFISVLPVVCLLMSQGTISIYDRLKPVFGNTARYTLMFFMLFILVMNFAKITVHNFFIDEPYREVTSLIRDNEAKHPDTGKAAILVTEDDFVYDGWKEAYFTGNPEESIPVYCMGGLPPAYRKYLPEYADKNREFTAASEIEEALREAKYDRIYLCYLHSRLDRKKEWQPILQRLYDNYDFGEKVNDYNFQILTRKQ